MKYLYIQNNIIYVECENCKRILKIPVYKLSEIKDGLECFCGSINDSINNLPEDLKIQYFNNSNSTETKNKKFIIKCPTCGSTNISKISLTSKAIGGVMFGLFSSNIRNTFRCNNCDYKW